MTTLTKNGSETRLVALEEVSNGGDEFLIPPFRAEVEIQGTAPLLFHRWNCEAVEEKANAAKGSKAKKTDNLESYVYRDEHGHLALPGEYLRMACIWAAKFRQDPRSPRKSAMDLYKAGLLCETEYAPIVVAGKKLKSWSYVDQRRVVVQRNGITRQRPAVEKGWSASFILSSLLPQYISAQDLNGVIAQAGQLIGLADFRPTYGRFQVVRFRVL
jgi:hypothetical protein